MALKQILLIQQLFEMNKNTSATVNPDVKVIVKKKAQKYKSAKPIKSNDSDNPLKAEGYSFSFTGSFQFSKKQPAWELFGKRKADPEGDVGLFSHKQVFGNDKEGEEWVEEQKKRQEQNIFTPGQVQQIKPQNSSEDQIIYIEPSVSEARLNKLRSLGRTFTDEDFPPNEYSLSGPYGPIPDWEPIKWRRTSFALEDSKIFEGKVEPNDIRQGFLGDCYFLAGLAALAERPDRIFNLFLLQERNDMNYFSVKMLYRGKWRTVDVDDYVPFIFNSPAFGKSNNNELWVLVLEKAWSKIYGCYKQIEAGFPEEPLHDLTGAPIKHIFLNRKGAKYEEQWSYLLQASIKEYAMVASSNPGSDTNQSANGISQGHAYTFLNATQLDVGGEKVKVVQLRNPWGRNQYKGKWSDGDKAWEGVAEDEQKRVNYVNNREDGVFFMEYDDFVIEFKNMTIAEINDNASYVYQSYYDPQARGAYFSVNIMHEGSYSFHVDKTPERSFTGEKQMKYRYPVGEVELAMIENDAIVKRFPAYISKRRSVYKQYELKPGTYIVLSKIQFDPNFEEDFEVNLAVYSEYACGIRLASQKEARIFEENDKHPWTGEKRRKPKPESEVEKNTPFGSKNSSKMNPNTPINPGPQIDENKRQTLFDFMERRRGDRNKNEEGFSNFTSKEQFKRPSSIHQSLGIATPHSGMKKKKIRTIEVHHKKVEIIEENENGEGVVTVEETQTRKQVIKNPQQQGGGALKSKEQEKKIDSKEYRLHGESINKRQKLTQTLRTKQVKPNGETVEKVQTQEHEIETLQIDDDDESNHSRITERKLQIEDEKPKQVKEVSYSSYDRPNERKINTIRKHLNEEKRMNDELRYQPSDDESDESLIYQK